MYLPPPSRGYQGSGDCESTDIGPPETEYGRAIHCDATDSGTLRGDRAAGGTRVPQRWWEQPRIDWNLEREQKERAAEAAGHTHATAGKKTTTETPGSGKGTGEEASLGASGSSGDEWSRAED